MKQLTLTLFILIGCLTSCKKDKTNPLHGDWKIVELRNNGVDLTDSLDYYWGDHKLTFLKESVGFGDKELFQIFLYVNNNLILEERTMIMRLRNQKHLSVGIGLISPFYVDSVILDGGGFYSISNCCFDVSLGSNEAFLKSVYSKKPDDFIKMIRL